MRHVAALQPDKSFEKIWCQELLQHSLASETNSRITATRLSYLSDWWEQKYEYIITRILKVPTTWKLQAYTIMAVQYQCLFLLNTHYHYQTQFLLYILSLRFMLLMQSVNL
jgi:hypothetical protein